MPNYVGLLRAVNVAGTKLPMTDLKRLAEAAGLDAVQTYIASGNLLFRSDRTETEVKAALEAGLADYFGKPCPVMVRTAAEMAETAAANPFPDAPPSTTLAIFLDHPAPADAERTAKNRAEDERIAVSGREVWVAYGAAGVGRSKLKIPAAANGTGRNANTVAKLAELVAKL